MNVLRSFRFPLGLLAVFVTAAVAAGPRGLPHALCGR